MGYTNQYPKSLTDCESLLKGKTHRQIGNNTYLERENENLYGIVLHNTTIVKFHKDGKIVLNSGGWQTVTTKERMNRYLSGIKVYSEKGVWYLGEFPFADGITIKSGKVDPKTVGDVEDIEYLRKRIKKYAKDYIKELFEGNIPKPSNGDCWYCLMKDETGKPLGECFKDKDHLLLHIEEKYYVPSLIVNAFYGAGYKQEQFAYFFCSIWGNQKSFISEETLKKDLARYLRRYLYRNLGLAS